MNTYLVRPTENREGKESRREPRVQDIRILLKYDFVLANVEFLGRLLFRLVLRTPAHPSIIIRGLNKKIIVLVFLTATKLSGISKQKNCLDSTAIDRNKVRGNTMTPPQLSRDAPIPDALHPVVPGFLELFGNDFQLATFHGLGCFCCHFVALDVPEMHTFIFYTWVIFNLFQYLNGRKLSYHWGFISGSTMSLDLLQTGTTMGLSLISTNNFLSISSLMIAFRAWKRFMP